MKIYKNKIFKVINFIKNEGKFERTDYVKVIKNKSGDLKYDTLLRQKAIVTNIDYSKKDYIIGVKFKNGVHLDFRPDELEKLDYKEMYTEEYKYLLNNI